ncbi:hypothetical protein CAEBREN_28624 [Caenorhabditis brenneri]|uniref:7TM GPCR serpentine receptor class x (Srx) domain-containing protein n=1 Tax=Caenorhabditis brenneri TaxID=135651 RepID=G0NHN5_CAEBE|nr:hypothetical protein CAEBREN_28624 [Caenorhabditis brenneri]
MESYNQTLFALLPISLIGSILNWSIFWAVHKLQSFNHSFGFLSANQAIADAMHSTMFLLYFCPMVLL